MVRFFLKKGMSISFIYINSCSSQKICIAIKK
nr:MAG TPA: hypothetical protein [Herelleviridae sp.]